MDGDRPAHVPIPCRRAFLKGVAASGLGLLRGGRTGADEAGFAPSDPANRPMGTARGIHPGRVAWIHDPKAATWDGTSGHWWDDRGTSPGRVAGMLSRALRALTDRSEDRDAWQALFEHHNARDGRAKGGYRPGEKIAVKINLNNGGSDNRIDASPQLVAALLRQLVGGMRVPQEAITVYDAQQPIGRAVSESCCKEFPRVGWNVGTEWVERAIRYSAEVESEIARRLPRCVLEADYLINMALLKRHHDEAAVTLCAKNHFGTIGSPSALHPYIRCWRRGLGSYDPLVDITAHRSIGGKTLLYLIDGLYGGDHWGAEPKRWRLDPFKGHWPASLLASQDPVAIDSVGLDFLRGEWPLLDHADNYLHEAALADRPPSGTAYDPSGDGKRPPSLGVHEHWNNAKEKQYSRNLGAGKGIELVPRT
jgi:uncharacterized protein (DUF362 family)